MEQKHSHVWDDMEVDQQDGTDGENAMCRHHHCNSRDHLTSQSLWQYLGDSFLIVKKEVRAVFVDVTKRPPLLITCPTYDNLTLYNEESFR